MVSFPVVEVLKPRGFKEERSDDALVAQWIERLVAVQKVAGSIPAKRTRFNISTLKRLQAQSCANK